MTYILYNITSGEIVCSRNNLASINRQLDMRGSEFAIAEAASYIPNFHTKYKDGVLVEATVEAKLEREMQALRGMRDIALQQSDWTQVPDAPVDQAAWATYRQALRDLPENTTDPANPVWPTKPQ
jgi:hypothetical protein